MSRVRRRQGLAAWRKALHLRMRRLRQADLGDGRHDHAWFEAAFARMVLGRLSHGHPFEWDFGAAIAKTARARLLQVGVAAVRQAAPRHGRAGPRAARRPRRGRRGRDPVADQGRSGLRRRRPLAPGQNVGRCRRSRKRRPRTPSPGRDQGLLRRLAAWLRRRQRRPGRDDQNRRLAASYARAPDVRHEPHVVGAMAAHVVLPWVHRAFSNAKTWALGVYHGLRRQYLQSYLDEFAFRFNRRRTRHAAFRSLLAIALVRKPLTYNMLIMPEAPG